MYTASLFIHSYVRWIVLAAALVVLVRAVGGLRRRRAWDAGDEAASRWFIISLDTQALLGIIIYLFLSPFTMAGWGDMGETMRNAPLRFIVVEHQVGMFIALALAHIGRARIRKAADAARRHRTAAIFYGLALVVMLLSIPWPFMPAGRELLRGLGI